MQKPTTRQEAADSGLTFYFTGEACRNGHTADRYTSNGNCAACVKDAGNKFSAAETRNRATVSNIRARAADWELTKELAEIDRAYEL